MENIEDKIREYAASITKLEECTESLSRTCKMILEHLSHDQAQLNLKSNLLNSKEKQQ